MVFFLLIFNLGITIFVFLLTAMMIFSQILFIIFAMFLPISFLLSMIPSYEGMAKQAVVKVFNTIMTRAGITLIVTVAFSISSMFYNMSDNYPFFMVAFLQIVTFAGIYFKLGDIMSMFSLNAGDSQNMGRRIFRRPYMFMRHRARRMERRMARAVGAGSVAGAVTGSMFSGGGSARNSNQNKEQRNNTASGSLGSRAGAKAGAVMDTKNRVKDKAQQVKEAVKDMPVQAGYAVYSATESAKKTVSDFKRGVTQEQETRQSGRTDKLNQRRQSVAQKCMEMQKAQEARRSEKQADGSATTGATRQHERPAVTPKPETKTVPKAEDKKRPAVATPTTTGKKTPVKERPATASVKVPEQRQSVQRQTVKGSDTPKPATTQEIKKNIQTERTVNTQRTRQVQKSQNIQNSQQTSQKKTSTHKKKGRRK